MKKKNKNLRFDNNVYNTLPGSLALCAYILTDWANETRKKPTWKDISTKTKALLKDSSLLISFDDPEYIQKTLNYYGMNTPEYFPIALIMGEYNNLFAPYIDGEILPLREDGLKTRTLNSPVKIIPICSQ